MRRLAPIRDHHRAHHRAGLACTRSSQIDAVWTNATGCTLRDRLTCVEGYECPYDKRVKEKTKAALATAAALATTGVGAVYVLVISNIDHSHEEQALRKNPAVLLLPTWPVVLLALAVVGLFVVTTVLTISATRSTGPSDSATKDAPRPQNRPTTSQAATSGSQLSDKPTRATAPNARIITSHLWTDHEGMRAHRQIDGRLRVVWATNGHPAGWLYPNSIGEWDVTNVDLEDIGSAATPQAGMEIIKAYMLKQGHR